LGEGGIKSKRNWNYEKKTIKQQEKRTAIDNEPERTVVRREKGVHVRWRWGARGEKTDQSGEKQPPKREGRKKTGLVVKRGILEA